MQQEIVEKSPQEKNFKDEKIRKILIIFVALLLFGATYYYYGGNKISFRHAAKYTLTSSSASTLSFPSSSVSTFSFPSSSVSEASVRIQSRTDSHAPSPEKSSKTKRSSNFAGSVTENDNLISNNLTAKPTVKSDLLALAQTASGKHDPFSYSESKSAPCSSDANSPSPSLPGALPPVPGAGKMGSLPSIPGLQGMPAGSPLGLAKPPAPSLEDLVTIKGFIGNKVIIEANGTVDALNVNQKISNIKILTVDPSTLTASFEINGKIITKTMRSLADTNYGSFDLVKNIH